MVFEDTVAPDAVSPLLESRDQSTEDASFSVFDRLGKDSYYWSGMIPVDRAWSSSDCKMNNIAQKVPKMATRRWRTSQSTSVTKKQILSPWRSSDTC